jgi:CheY-like chemotaxis protein
MSAVLVVDDDPAVRKSLARLIRSMGAEADCAAGGIEALAYVADRTVDLILLDYAMPDLDGLAVLARLRADPRTRDLPVLVCTGTLFENVRERALALGASGFVAKGEFDADVLREWIGSLIPRG